MNNPSRGAHSGQYLDANVGVWRAMFTVAHSKAFHRWVQAVNFWIFVSCIALAMETVEPFATTHAALFRVVEICAVAFSRWTIYRICISRLTVSATYSAFGAWSI